MRRRRSRRCVLTHVALWVNPLGHPLRRRFPSNEFPPVLSRVATWADSRRALRGDTSGSCFLTCDTEPCFAHTRPKAFQPCRHLPPPPNRLAQIPDRPIPASSKSDGKLERLWNFLFRFRLSPRSSFLPDRAGSLRDRIPLSGTIRPFLARGVDVVRVPRRLLSTRHGFFVLSENPRIDARSSPRDQRPVEECGCDPGEG